MRVSVNFEGVSHDDDLHDKVIEAFSPLSKQTKNFSQDLLVSQVHILKRPRWGYRVRFNMQLPSKHIHAESKGDDLMQTVRAVRDIAKRQLRKHMEKLQEH